jgi:hypothetical protein
MENSAATNAFNSLSKEDREKSKLIHLEQEIAL